MITTINDSTNGFRRVLLPIALCDQSLSSQSLRQSIMALSATHLYNSNAAVKYKLNAIRLLSRSFELEEPDACSQLATCMMLCVTDVCQKSLQSLSHSPLKCWQVFDGVDGSWFTHLKAAKALSSRIAGKTYNQQSTHFLVLGSLIMMYSQTSASIGSKKNRQ